MHSLTRIKVLQRRCTVFHSQCESILLRYQDEDRGLQAEEEAILEQIAGLKLLLDTLRAENRQLSREEIYTLLRKQSCNDPAVPAQLSGFGIGLRRCFHL